MPNMKQIISTHNKSVIRKNKAHELTQDTKDNCNCRKDRICPLDGKCLTSGLIYLATVTRQDNPKDETYVGLTDNTFKTRYNGHTSSFRNENKRNAINLR